MSVQLRDYQSDLITKVRENFSRVRSVLIQSPTGSGKTLLTAFMLGTASKKNKTCWFLVHRRELIKQSIETFGAVGIDHGVIAPSFFMQPEKRVQIASVQTVARRFSRIPKPDLIVWDEAHHVAAKSWAVIHDAFSSAYHIGLTATPERLDGTGLGKWFASLVHGPAVTWLIENGFLCPYKLYSPPSGIVTKGLHTRMGDFVKSELVSAVDKPTITGDAIKHYQAHAAGRRAVVFCVSIEHSKHVVDQFRNAGIVAAHVDGETPTDERDDAIRRFRNGDIKVLSNVELFGEGFDLPALECAILLRPTQSLGLYLQQVGRALRPFPGKECAIILDHAGNCQRHGLPDEVRAWSLDGVDKKQKRDEDAGPPVRICKKCFAAQPAGALICKVCGTEFEIQSREVEQVEGELQEVDLEAMRIQRKKQQGQAKSYDELIALAKSRGYKSPYAWANHILRARQAKAARGMA